MSGHGKGATKLLLISLAAFLFTFSLVPIYRIACEKVFGIRLDKTAADGSAVAAPAQGGRLVTVQFDGGVNSRLPWAFHPNQASMRVRVGEQYETTYLARNNSTAAVVGSATPSVAPARASGYFSKTECFCFTAQTLAAGESRDMPVRFIIDPALPADVNDVLTARLAGAASGAPASTVPRAAP